VEKVFINNSIEKYIFDIDKMNINIHKGKPALKKPLLLLLIISKFEKGIFYENRITYIDIENELSQLIEIFGGRPSSSGAKPGQPFQYLSSSSFWNLHLPKDVKLIQNKDLSINTLKNRDTYVTLDENLYYILKESKEDRLLLSEYILHKWWPSTIQDELRSILDLPCRNVDSFVNNVNSDFSNLVLENFRYKCAVCGYSAFFNKSPFGIDGIHIKWSTLGGPERIENGLSLCKIHSCAFDRGVISIHHNSLEVLVSSKFVGLDEMSIMTVEKLKGQPMFPFKDMRPSSLYLEWHNDYIFVG
jgi:putative restriction endonuclease